MSLCKECPEGFHQVAGKDDPNCDCGCHHVLVLKKYDRQTWWIPSEKPDIGHALKLRERPIPGLILEYFFREPSPLGEAGPWVETNEVELDMAGVRALKQILRMEMPG